jgi:hypothetical protein
VALVIILLLSACGCQEAHPAVSPTTTAALQGLAAPQYFDVIRAACSPPLGWLPEPLKQDPLHTHQIWVSPTGRTAYGVIHFNLPLPVSTDLALWGFLSQMKRTEGQATLLEKQPGPNQNQIRFVAEGGQHRVRANLLVHGFEGWAIYAGTLKDDAVDAHELSLAEKARDCTKVQPR